LSSDLKARLRTAALLLLGGYILLGPAYQEWLGGSNKYIRKWSMFHSTKGICLVDYLLEDEHGERVEVDRFEVLETERSKQSPLFRISSRKEAISVGYRMCRKLDPKAALYLEARCGTRVGWRVVNEGLVDMCQQARDKRTGRRPPGVPAGVLDTLKKAAEGASP